MVVNNQGRIGKALIPFFVLLHLIEGMEGMGLGCSGEGRVREQGTLGSWQNGCCSLKKLGLFVIFSRQRKAESRNAHGMHMRNLCKNAQVTHAGFLCFFFFAYSYTDGRDLCMNVQCCWTTRQQDLCVCSRSVTKSRHTRSHNIKPSEYFSLRYRLSREHLRSQCLCLKKLLIEDGPTTLKSNLFGRSLSSQLELSV